MEKRGDGAVGTAGRVRGVYGDRYRQSVDPLPGGIGRRGIAGIGEAGHLARAAVYTNQVHAGERPRPSHAL
jgi:hypothetical protein